MANPDFDISQLPQSLQDRFTNTLVWPPLNLEEFHGGPLDMNTWGRYNATFGGYVVDPQGKSRAQYVLETAATDVHATSRDRRKPAAVRTYRRSATVKAVGGLACLRCTQFGSGFASGSWVAFGLTGGGVAGTIVLNQGYGTWSNPNPNAAITVNALDSSWYDIIYEFQTDATEDLLYGWECADSSGNNSYAGSTSRGFALFNPRLLDIT